MPTGTPFSPTPFSSSVVAPQTVSEFRRASYITPSEFRFAPTAVGTTALVAGSVSQADSLSSLARVIERASAWADLICFHRADGTLAASVTTESGWITPKPSGSLALVCNFRPVLEVTGLGLGITPSQLGSIESSTAADIWIDGKVIWVPGWWNASSPSQQGASPPFLRIASGGRLFAVWTYVNGFPHTTLAANVLQNANSISVNPSTPNGTAVMGVYAGTQLTINDGDKTEVVVASAAPTGTTISLATGTQFAHTVPTLPDAIRVSSLPRTVEQAVISLTSVLIKTRGSRAMVLPSTPGGIPTKQAMAQAGATDDYDDACRLLEPFTVSTLHG